MHASKAKKMSFEHEKSWKTEKVTFISDTNRPSTKKDRNLETSFQTELYKGF